MAFAVIDAGDRGGAFPRVRDQGSHGSRIFQVDILRCTLTLSLLSSILPLSYGKQFARASCKRRRWIEVATEKS